MATNGDISVISLPGGSSYNVKDITARQSIENLPKPMVFKGTLGTGGTITSLPTAAAGNVGHTYKVITAGTYTSISAKVGDLFICRAKGTSPETYEWVLVPSGDEPSGTVTSVGLNNGTGISISGTDNPITTSGTLTITNTGVTQLTAGSNITLSATTGNVTISAAGGTLPSTTNILAGDGNGGAIASTIKPGTATGAEVFNASGNTASGQCSHAEGGGSIEDELPFVVASGDYSHAEGLSTTASGGESHAEGDTTEASGIGSHAEGGYTKASNYYSHAEGDMTQASETASHAEGSRTVATGVSSHAEGNSTTASGNYSHAEGTETIASGDGSHVEGYGSIASGEASHAEGGETQALSPGSHAEGLGTIAGQDEEEGYATHAEGYETRAVGLAAHSEGSNTIAGNWAHAEGQNTQALAPNSHSEGLGTVASSNVQHVQGQYNVIDSSSVYADIVGKGSSDSNRKNISALDWNGSLHLKGNIYVGCNDDSTGGTVLQNTTYTFAGGTNQFTVTPAGGSAQTVAVTPSIANNALTTTTIGGSVTAATAATAGVSGSVQTPTVTINKSTVTAALGYTPGTSNLTIGTASTNAAAGNHTHNYAGSSSVGGVANSAAKLSNTSAIGGTTQPVYFTSSGVPTVISYTIAKSVPSNAVFTDTQYVPTGGATNQVLAKNSATNYDLKWTTALTSESLVTVTAVNTTYTNGELAFTTITASYAPESLTPAEGGSY